MTRSIDRSWLDNAGTERKVPARDVEVEKVEQLVFDKRAAHAHPRLVPYFGRVERRITVPRVQRPVAEKPVHGPVQAVAAALGHSVDHSAHGAPVFSRIIRRQHLELLNRVLRDLGGDARPSRVFVVVLLGRIVAVLEKGVAACHATETKQTERPVVGHARCGQRERVDAPPVDRQIPNLLRLDHLRDVRLGVFDNRRR